MRQFLRDVWVGVVGNALWHILLGALSVATVVSAIVIGLAHVNAFMAHYPALWVGSVSLLWFGCWMTYEIRRALRDVRSHPSLEPLKLRRDLDGAVFLPFRNNSDAALREGVGRIHYFDATTNEELAATDYGRWKDQLDRTVFLTREGTAELLLIRHMASVWIAPYQSGPREIHRFPKTGDVRIEVTIVSKKWTSPKFMFLANSKTGEVTPA